MRHCSERNHMNANVVSTGDEEDRQNTMVELLQESL